MRPEAYMILDGAWGSCGKGLLAGKLALDRNPDTIVCNFGPNAGHTYRYLTAQGDVRSIMTQQLPTGAVNKGSYLLLGPGSIIDPHILQQEIEALEGDLDIRRRLFIHPRASVVTATDKEREQPLITIGSTRKGTASAACRKMMRFQQFSDDASPLPRIAKEHEFLQQFVLSECEYDNIIRNSYLIQIESAQGIELSLNRGFSYPTCTGRDVTPEQVLNDTAVPMRFLTETCLVVRTYPIRVGNEYDLQGREIGNSGPVFLDQEELTWEQLSQEAGTQLLERTTVTKKVRRIFRFSKDQIRHALYVAGRCSVFLNYMNYLDPNTKDLASANDKARGFFYDTLETINEYNGSTVKWLGWGPAYHQVEER